MAKEIDDLKNYINNPKPFGLLEIETSGKSLSELFLELNLRTEEEFTEYCYRSMKNYTDQMFRETVFYRRSRFLHRHLVELSLWLYRSEEFFPEDLLKAGKKYPPFVNPWGVKEYPKHLIPKPLFKKGK